MRRLALALLLATQALQATEKALPSLQRERLTSTEREISIKPLFVYSARGRRDPFTFDSSPMASSATQNSNITELKLVGIMGTAEAKTAIFYDTLLGTTYRFKRGKLFGPDGVVVANIKGAFLPGRRVTLIEGESNVLYQLANDSRMDSLDQTIAQDRKELQR
jgi:hypothetical protein